MAFLMAFQPPIWPADPKALSQCGRPARPARQTGLTLNVCKLEFNLQTILSVVG